MYCFQRAEETDIARVMELIEQRIRWMDERGIDQWNKNGYLNAYPEAYYREAMAKRQLFVLRGETTKRVYGALVLRETDENWDDGESAYYVNNLVADQNEKGAGLYMLSFCDVLARSKKKKYLRLDCARDNEKLNAYYARQGFEKVGECEDGPYLGNRLQKDLTKGCNCCHHE